MTTTKSIAKPKKKQIPNNGAGRPPGAKNKTTIFKEAMREGFELALQKDFKKVIDAVVSKAVDGDMQAAKILMDRIIPVQKSIDMEDLNKQGGIQISVNIGQLESPSDLYEAEDASFEEIK